MYKKQPQAELFIIENDGQCSMEKVGRLLVFSIHVKYKGLLLIKWNGNTAIISTNLTLVRNDAFSTYAAELVINIKVKIHLHEYVRLWDIYI